jgi:predicted nucleic acid-binding protein
MVMLDTSFVVAYYNTRDQNHEHAAKTAKLLATQNYPLYITDYIFGEIITVSFFKLKSLGKAVHVGKMVLESCNLLHTEKEIFEQAWKIFSEQKLRLSFVDCTTVAAMRGQKMQKIATFDGDFSKISGLEILG